MFGNKSKKTRQQRELDRLIKEHRELCKEVRQRISEYKSLNRELSSVIADCKRAMAKLQKEYLNM